MKIILTSLLLVFFVTGFSQSSTKFYFDGDMHQVSKQKAEISGAGEMDSGLFKLTCYYGKRKHPLAGVAHYTDSTLHVHEGWLRYYYDNGTTKLEGNYRHGEKDGLWVGYNREGKIEDSTEYKNGRATRSTEYYDFFSSHQKLITVDDVTNHEFYTTLIDARGGVISQDHIPEDYSDLYINPDTLATFPGGPSAWNRYVSQAIMKHIEDLSDADYGTVLLRFVVDTSGNVSEVRPLDMKYSKLTMIAFNALDTGPKWIPAIHNGKKVRSIRIQPVTLANQ